ncbi:MAG: DNA-directed RNA polymerase subunit omega [Chlorobi bacterium CHB2]|nr:DNA-directed RNA polymerase subunit omega [Chlorobi bacterium CHB2]
MPIRPVDLKQATGEAGSIYEAIVIMSRRARQINDELRDNLQARIAEVANPNDDDTETVNPDQLEAAREFDHIPKPTFLALDEMLDGDLEYRYREPQY